MVDDDAMLGLMSDRNFFSEKISQKFKEKYVDAITFQKLEDIKLEQFDYLIINLLDNVINHSEVEKVVSNSKVKTILLFPLTVSKKEADKYEQIFRNLLDLNPDIEIILVPEILGKDVKYNNSNISHDLIMQSIVGDRIKIKSSERPLILISVNKLVDKLTNEIFSFGQSGKKVAIIGSRRKPSTIAFKYLKVRKENVIFLKNEYDYVDLNFDVAQKTAFSVRLAINNTKKAFQTFTQEKNETDTESLKFSEQNKKTDINIFKNLTIALSLVISIYLIPLFLALISTLLLLSSAHFLSRDLQVATKLVNGSVQFSKLTTNISFGNSFYYNLASILQRLARLETEGIDLLSNLRVIMPKIVSTGSYDHTLYLDDISATLDKIYADISFLQTEIPDFKILVNSKLNISEIKSQIHLFHNLTSRMSYLLGSEKPMKYLVLFQNNMELRPTGGFIGSYATLTFDKGKLTEINVSDVYTADGQLKGHVDPPEPIRNYLGEGGWTLRDSNWSPSFPESAQKAEWFYSKELNDKLDGVVAIDLEFVKSLLTITGPIELKDFNKVITSANLYQEIQNEVENDFFPGSIKKTSLLTSLARNLILSIEMLPEHNYFQFFKIIYESLERKHIQLYLHDQNAQVVLTKLHFDGAVSFDINCSVRCFNDGYMVVDANLGVNKANMFINRYQIIDTILSKESIGHELLLTYENTAGVAIGTNGVYKNYMRLLVPENAVVNGVRLYNFDGSYSDIKYDENIVNNNKEIGFLIDILPHTQKSVQISWTINSNALMDGGEYNLQVYKQAGTVSDKLKVIVRTKDLSLTGNANPVYNTDLTVNHKTKFYLK